MIFKYDIIVSNKNVLIISSLVLQIKISLSYNKSDNRFKSIYFIRTPLKHSNLVSYLQLRLL